MACDFQVDFCEPVMQEVAKAVGGTVEGVDSVEEKGGMKDIDRTGHIESGVVELHVFEELHFGEDIEDDVEDLVTDRNQRSISVTTSPSHLILHPPTVITRENLRKRRYTM